MERYRLHASSSRSGRGAAQFFLAYAPDLIDREPHQPPRKRSPRALLAHRSSDPAFESEAKGVVPVRSRKFVLHDSLSYPVRRCLGPLPASGFRPTLAHGCHFSFLRTRAACGRPQARGRAEPADRRASLRSFGEHLALASRAKEDLNGWAAPESGAPRGSALARIPALELGHRRWLLLGPFAQLGGVRLVRSRESRRRPARSTSFHQEGARDPISLSSPAPSCGAEPARCFSGLTNGTPGSAPRRLRRSIRAASCTRARRLRRRPSCTTPRPGPARMVSPRSQPAPCEAPPTTPKGQPVTARAATWPADRIPQPRARSVGNRCRRKPPQIRPSAPGYELSRQEIEDSFWPDSARGVGRRPRLAGVVRRASAGGGSRAFPA